MDEYGELMNCSLLGENVRFRNKPTPMSLHPPHIPYDITSD
jgi:hypothetical protein